MVIVESESLLLGWLYLTLFWSRPLVQKDRSTRNTKTRFIIIPSTLQVCKKHRFRQRLTPGVTGPPPSTPNNHTKSASAASVHAIVRLRFCVHCFMHALSMILSKNAATSSVTPL